MGVPGKLATTSELSDDQIDLDQIESVGLFGVRPYWKDGHNTGIYGLSLLLAICPCEECAAARDARRRLGGAGADGVGSAAVDPEPGLERRLGHVIEDLVGDPA